MDTEVKKRGFDARVLELARMVYRFGNRVPRRHFIDKRRPVDDYINEFINCGRNYAARRAPVKILQVCAAADKTDAKRSANDYHTKQYTKRIYDCQKN